MALIKCPDCGREVSDRADKCPSCAFPLNQAYIRASSLIGIGIGGIISAVAIGYVAGSFWVGLVLVIVALALASRMYLQYKK